MGLEIGQTVRYSRTGTVGKIVSLINENGYDFAELDTTGLCYRLDQLIEINEVVEESSKNKDVRKDILDEQVKIRDMQESAWQNTDQSCEGGG